MGSSIPLIRQLEARKAGGTRTSKAQLKWVRDELASAFPATSIPTQSLREALAKCYWRMSLIADDRKPRGDARARNPKPRKARSPDGHALDSLSGSTAAKGERSLSRTHSQQAADPGADWSARADEFVRLAKHARLIREELRTLIAEEPAPQQVAPAEQ